MGFFEEELQSFVDGFFKDVNEASSGLAEKLIEPAIQLMLGTPAPRTNNWVFGTPTNAPWDTLIPDVYYIYMVPLAFGLLMVGSAYVALLSPSMSDYTRKKTMRRFGYALVSMLLWIYLASMALQFFNGLAISVAPTPQEMINTYGNLSKSLGGGLLLALIATVIENLFLVFAIIIYAARYVLIYTLTLSMPILFVFWALEAGPMKHFAGLAGKLMGLYPGLLISTLPAAIMFRIAYATQLEFSMGGIAGFFVSLMFIPTATALTAFLILNSNKYIESATERGANIAAPAGSYAGGRSARTVRDVHRGMTGRASAHNTAAYKAASRARSTARSTFSRVRRRW